MYNYVKRSLDRSACMPLRVLYLLESCYCYMSTIADHEFTNYERAQALGKHQDCQIGIWKTASSRSIPRQQ